ncbi:hypothetical protein CEC48_08205 [Pseudomonas sp. K2I15]|nr:hypothetical protein CEC48_08205 [Pseudomonas sp. K2I15]
MPSARGRIGDGKRCEHRSREQRRSNVGAGLLAKAVDQPPNASTDTPHSRASPLPQWMCGVAYFFSSAEHAALKASC